MLRYKADIRTLGFVGTYFALVILQWLWAPSDWLIAAPLFLATCAFSWFCAVITHNTVHCAVFESRGLNKAFQVVLTLTYGHPVSSYVSGHNLSHHMYVQEDRDVMRTTKVRYRWNLLNLLMFVPKVGGAITKGDFAFAKIMRKQRPRWFRQFAIEAAVLIVVTVTLFILDWKKALLYWYVPHLWAAWGIIAINFLQHDGCDETSKWNHSRNFTGRFFGWWTFNNGFHGIHHMHPNLHWSLARQRHEEELAPNIHPELDQPSIAAYAWKAFIWPGKRVRFDGAPLVLPPEVPDRSWIPAAKVEDLPANSLGAES
ncbi:MAG: fatty acid desaturase [Deltaproteobacteria bacterium]|nr:fatty acid desaturase [Deltaproteobacteria bacterium]